MPMPSYPVCCTSQGCGQLAAYKIASRWSDGVTRELKTYALTCAACLSAAFRGSSAKQAACRLAPGETLESPGIYELVRGCHDLELKRRNDLENEANAPKP